MHLLYIMSDIVKIDDNIIIENLRFGSPILYIQDVTKIKKSPLKTFIEEGVIVHNKIDNLFVDSNYQIIKMTRNKTTNVSNMIEFKPYHFFRELEDRRNDDNIGINEVDCLRFAELLSYIHQHPDSIQTEGGINRVIEQQVHPEISTPLFKLDVSFDPTKMIGDSEEDLIPESNFFGDSYKNNSRIVNSIKKENKRLNEKVNPDQGDAYAIVNKKVTIDDNLTPYHVAFVIYSNDQYNITLEVLADFSSKKKVKVFQPKFNFYNKPNNNPNERTFHEVYSHQIENPHTIHLIPIEKEIENVVLPTTVFDILGKRKSSQPPPALMRSSKRSQIQTPTRSRRNGGGIKRKSYTKTKKTKQTKQPIR